jgi:hypothetical protein
MKPFTDLADFSEMAKRLAIFEMSYLLKSWELDCSCSPDQRKMFVGHSGGILVQV